MGALAALALPSAAHAGGGSRLQAAAPGAILHADAARGMVRFAHTRAGVRGISSPADAAKFLERHGDAFGLAGELTARPRPGTTHRLGHTQVHFSALYRGVPVYGAGWSLHFDASGALVAVRAASVPSIAVSETPSFGVAEAGALAVDLVPGAERFTDATLLIFDRGLVTGQAPDPRLAYRVVVEGAGQRHEVFVDAHVGERLLVASRTPQILERRVYQGEYGPANVLWQDADGPYAGGDAEVVDYIAFTEDTYDLFESVSGGVYPSYDGASAPMEGVVGYGTGCPNATWNGTSTNYCVGLVTDDVVAHEWAHAYSQLNHDLIYAYQPGALNESYSDIFGETVDLLNESGDGPHELREDGSCASGAGSSERWLIGEETSGLGGAIRDMWTPTCFGHPGRVGDGEYICTNDDFFDNGGVPFNSGVPNHAFALLVDGGSSNGEVVPAIGMIKALALYWRAMTVYQEVTSGFADHADALTAACEDLVAAGADLPDPVSGVASGEMMNEADCMAVESAIAATQLLDDPGCGVGTLLDPGPAPSACDRGEPSTLLEASFEDGLGGWTRSSEGALGSFEPRDWELAGELPRDRAGQAVFATGDLYIGHCSLDDESGVLHLDSPAFTIPDDDAAVVLSFDHWVATQPRFDGGNVKISRDGGPFELVPAAAFRFNPYSGSLDPSDNPLAGEPAFTGSDAGVATGTWVSSQVELDGLAGAGDEVVLRFDFGVDACNGLFGWYVDDVEVVACVGDVDPTSTSTGSAATSSTSDSTSVGPISGGTAADESTSSGSGGTTTTGVSTMDASTTGRVSEPGEASGESSSDPAGMSDGEDGCGCTQSGSGGGWSWLAFGVLGGVLRRRRSPSVRRG